MAKANKRYYWLKLKGDFFNDKRIKKLRKIAGGDTYTIIYLKLLLLSLETEGRLYFEGVEENFGSEISLEIDEDEDNVNATLFFLNKQGLLEGPREDEYFLTEIPYLIGSETASARRVRKMRQQQVSQCNANVTDCNKMKQIGNGEIDKEIDKEKKSSHSGLSFSLSDGEKNRCLAWMKNFKLDENTSSQILSELEKKKQGDRYLKEKLILVSKKGPVIDNIGLLIKAIRDDYK